MEPRRSHQVPRAHSVRIQDRGDPSRNPQHPCWASPRLGRAAFSFHLFLFSRCRVLKCSLTPRGRCARLPRGAVRCQVLPTPPLQRHTGFWPPWARSLLLCRCVATRLARFVPLHSLRALDAHVLHLVVVGYWLLIVVQSDRLTDARSMQKTLGKRHLETPSSSRDAENGHPRRPSVKVRVRAHLCAVYWQRRP